LKISNSPVEDIGLETIADTNPMALVGRHISHRFTCIEESNNESEHWYEGFVLGDNKVT